MDSVRRRPARVFISPASVRPILHDAHGRRFSRWLASSRRHGRRAHHEVVARARHRLGANALGTAPWSESQWHDRLDWIASRSSWRMGGSLQPFDVASRRPRGNRPQGQRCDPSWIAAHLASTLLGTITAALVGWFCITLLIKAVQRGRWWWFAVYVWLFVAGSAFLLSMQSKEAPAAPPVSEATQA